MTASLSNFTLDREDLFFWYKQKKPFLNLIEEVI